MSLNITSGSKLLLQIFNNVYVLIKEIINLFGFNNFFLMIGIFNMNMWFFLNKEHDDANA